MTMTILAGFWEEKRLEYIISSLTCIEYILSSQLLFNRYEHFYMLGPQFLNLIHGCMMESNMKQPVSVIVLRLQWLKECTNDCIIMFIENIVEKKRATAKPYLS